MLLLYCAVPLFSRFEYIRFYINGKRTAPAYLFIGLKSWQQLLNDSLQQLEVNEYE